MRFESVVLVAAGFALLSGLTMAQAPEAPAASPGGSAGTRIGYVDIDKITAKAKQSELMDKVSGEVRRIQRDYQEKLDKVRDLEREISRMRGVVSDSEISKKQKEVDRLKNEIDELELRSTRELQKIDDTVFTPLVKQIGYAIEEVAKEQNFDLVLRGEAVFYGSPSVDLTEDVIKKLDFSEGAANSAARSNSAKPANEPKQTPRPAFTEEKPSTQSNAEPAKSATPTPRPAARTRPVDRQQE